MTTGSLEYRLVDHEELDVDIDAELVERVREEVLDLSDASEETTEEYRSGWVDAAILFDRLLTDPEYFGISDNEDNST